MKDPASIEDIRSLYLEKSWSVSRIAMHFGVTRQAIYERMCREGVQYRSKMGLGATEIPRSELERLYIRERLTIAEIARQTGHSWSVVAGVLDRCGIERLNNRELSAFTPGFTSMQVGDRLEVETDGRFPSWICHQAKRLNFRVVIRSQTPTNFLIIRTPLLGPKTIRSLVEQGLSPKEIARIFMSDPKTIRKLIGELSGYGSV